MSENEEKFTKQSLSDDTQNESAPVKNDNRLPKCIEASDRSISVKQNSEEKLIQKEISEIQKNSSLSTTESENQDERDLAETDNSQKCNDPSNSEPLADSTEENADTTELDEEDILNEVAAEINPDDPENGSAGEIITGIIDEEKIENIFNNTYEDAKYNCFSRIKFFRDRGITDYRSAQNALDTVTNFKTFEQLVKDNGALFVGVSSFSKGMYLPFQLFMGLMFKSLKNSITKYNKNNDNKIKFEQYCQELLPSISNRCRQRLMVASDIVECDVDESLYTVGFERIYNIMTLRRNKYINDDSEVEKLLTSFKTFSIHEDITSDNFSRFSKHILNYYQKFKEGVDIDQKLYGQIYNSGGSLSSKDIGYINKYFEKYDNFENEYLEALCRYDFDTRKAIEEMEDYYNASFTTINYDYGKNDYSTTSFNYQSADTEKNDSNNNEDKTNSNATTNTNNEETKNNTTDEKSKENKRTVDEQDNQDPIYNKLIKQLSVIKKLLIDNSNYKFSIRVNKLSLEIAYVLANKSGINDESFYKVFDDKIDINDIKLKYKLDSESKQDNKA